MPLLGFDIETANIITIAPGENLDDHGPLDLTVASTQWAEGLAFDEGHASARIQRHCAATVDRILGESRQTAHALLEIAVRELLLPRNLRCALEAPRTSKPGTPR